MANFLSPGFASSGQLRRTEEQLELLAGSPIYDSMVPFLTDMATRGWKFSIATGLRSLEEQEKIYNRKASNALPGTSPHNFGLAFDIVLLDDDGKTPLPDNHDRWKLMGRLGTEKYGMVWGGNFQNFPGDFGHFEHPKAESGVLRPMRRALGLPQPEDVKPGVKKNRKPVPKGWNEHVRTKMRPVMSAFMEDPTGTLSNAVANAISQADPTEEERKLQEKLGDEYTVTVSESSGWNTSDDAIINALAGFDDPAFRDEVKNAVGPLMRGEHDDGYRRRDPIKIENEFVKAFFGLPTDGQGGASMVENDPRHWLLAKPFLEMQGGGNRPVTIGDRNAPQPGTEVGEPGLGYPRLSSERQPMSPTLGPGPEGPDVEMSSPMPTPFVPGVGGPPVNDLIGYAGAPERVPRTLNSGPANLPQRRRPGGPNVDPFGADPLGLSAARRAAIQPYGPDPSEGDVDAQAPVEILGTPSPVPPPEPRFPSMAGSLGDAKRARQEYLEAAQGLIDQMPEGVSMDGLPDIPRPELQDPRMPGFGGALGAMLGQIAGDPNAMALYQQRVMTGLNQQQRNQYAEAQWERQAAMQERQDIMSNRQLNAQLESNKIGQALALLNQGADMDMAIRQMQMRLQIAEAEFNADIARSNAYMARNTGVDPMAYPQLAAAFSSDAASVVEALQTGLEKEIKEIQKSFEAGELDKASAVTRIEKLRVQSERQVSRMMAMYAPPSRNETETLRFAKLHELTMMDINETLGGALAQVNDIFNQDVQAKNQFGFLDYLDLETGGATSKAASAVGAGISGLKDLLTNEDAFKK